MPHNTEKPIYIKEKRGYTMYINLYMEIYPYVCIHCLLETNIKKL